MRAKERLSAASADVETVGRTIPVCYNGDLFSVSNAERFLVEYPDADDLMFGRGMLIDPALVMRLRAKSADPAEKSAARGLHRRLFAAGGRAGCIYRPDAGARGRSTESALRRPDPLGGI